MTKQYLTPAEVSRRYDGRISERTLNNWRSQGGGPPFVKLGGRVVYPVEKLDAWEAARTFESTSKYASN